MSLCIRFQKLHRLVPCVVLCSELARDCQHGCGYIDTCDRALCADPICQAQRGVAATATNIEHLFTGLGGQAIHHGLSQRLQHGLHERIVADPVLTGLSVPEFDLGRVLYRHGSSGPV